MTDVSFIIKEKLPIIDDYLYGRRFPTKSKGTTPVLIVDINDETVKRYGYVRPMYADVIEGILKGKPKVLAIDNFFCRIRDLKEDLKLIKIFENAESNIVLAYFSQELDSFLLRQINPETHERIYKNNNKVTIANITIAIPSKNNEITAFVLNPDYFSYEQYLPFPMEVVSKYVGGAVYVPYADAGFDFNTAGIRHCKLGDMMIPSMYESIPDYYTFINYTDREFPSIPLWRVNETDSTVFKDKIVLIGASAPLAGDILSSPASKKIPGVYILAHAIDMLLNRNFITPVELKLQKVMTFLAAFVISIISLTLKRLPAFFVTIFSIIVIKLLTDVLFYHYLLYMY
ncbi:MAG: CHASE2 domain-containing protein, partial [Nitrospirae bacterium]|nr:CHASE2 domain-containing protein [Nitrospirota bacterium]